MSKVSKIYVGNINFKETAETLTTMLSPYGEVKEVKLITDRDTGRSKGYAFVTMDSPESAQKAIDALNGTTQMDREIKVNEAEEKKRDRPSGGGYPRSNDRGGFSRRDRDDR